MNIALMYFCLHICKFILKKCTLLIVILLQFMTQKQQIALYVKHYKEDRSQSQITLTNRLALLLTQSNINRLQSKRYSTFQNTKVKKQDFLYVCIHGLPPYKDQFLNLNLPGQIIRYKFTAFNNYLNNDFYQQYSFKEEAAFLHQAIQSASKTKAIVFVFHSFGTFFLATYLQSFSGSRVIGMIDIGGAPIRAYRINKGLLQYLHNFSVEKLKKEIDDIYINYKIGGQPHSKFPFMFNKNYSKQELLSFLIIYKKYEPFRDMYESIRNWPKVLKCFIYGRNDQIMVQQLQNQKAIYFCYKDQFDKAYDERLKYAWKNTYGFYCENVQQKFIFNIEKGAHSIHLQKKFNTLLQQIISQYLTFIQNAENFNSAKL